MVESSTAQNSRSSHDHSRVDPARRRPTVSQESTRLGLDRTELGAFLVQAGLSGGNDHVLTCLLALTARRVAPLRLMPVAASGTCRASPGAPTRARPAATTAHAAPPTYIVATYLAGATGAR